MSLIGQLLYMAIEIYIFIIIISVIVSWLIAFNVISQDHPATRNLLKFLGRATDPVMRPAQRYIPSIGGIDISPIIVIFGLMILQSIIVRLFMGGMFL
jgi:YggT family protein